MVATIHPGQVDGQYADSLTRTLLWDANNGMRITRWGGVIAMETSPRIAAARNDVVRQFRGFRETKPVPPEWLLWIDSDMVWTPEDFEKAMGIVEENDDIKILGGLCFGGGRSARAFPTLYVVEGEPGNYYSTVPKRYPEDELVEVSATGSAWVLIHHTVFDELYDRLKEVNGKKNTMIWYRDGTQEGQEFGEDIWFCLAAGGAGFPTYVHTGIEIGHMKRFNLNADYYKEKVRDVADSPTLD